MGRRPDSLDPSNARPLQRQEIQAFYERKWVTISELSAITGLPRSRLYRWRREDHWSAPNKAQTEEIDRTEPGHREAGPLPRILSSKQKTQLVDRLFGVVEDQMSKLETKLYGPGDADVSERDNRTLGTLARTLEKLIKMDGAGEDAGADNGEDQNVDQQLRAQLEARIARALQTGTD
jgi:hypothetical protein